MPPHCRRSLKLVPADLWACFQQIGQGATEIRRLREKCCCPPLPPDQGTQAVFRNRADQFPSKARKEPPLWVKLLCEHRENFSGLVLGSSFDEGDPCLSFLVRSTESQAGRFPKAPGACKHVAATQSDALHHHGRTGGPQSSTQIFIVPLESTVHIKTLPSLRMR